MPPKNRPNNAHSRLNSPAPARQAENGSTSVPPGSNPPTPPITPERPTTPMPNNSRTGTRALRVHTDTSSTAGAGPSTAQAGTATATAGPLGSAVGDLTSRRIDELLHTMQQTLSSLASTFDVLGEQTLSVATLGPAVDARVKIDKVRQDVHDQHVEQDSAMQETMTDVQERVKAHIRDVLRPQVDRLVSAKVGEYIEGRVRAQLAAQVSEHVDLQELREYRRRIEEIKVKLHNAEAIRHNSRLEYPYPEPIRQLMRPLPAPGAPLGTPGPLNAPNAEVEGGPGTPSLVHPQTVDEIVRIDAVRARRLRREYGIGRAPVDGETQAQVDADVEVEEESAEDGEDGANGTANGGANGSANGNANGNANAGRGRGQGGGGQRGGRPGVGGASGSGAGGAGRGRGGDQTKASGSGRGGAGARTVSPEVRERARVADLNAFLQYIGLAHMRIYPSRRGAATMVSSPSVPRQQYRPW